MAAFTNRYSALLQDPGTATNETDEFQPVNVRSATKTHHLKSYELAERKKFPPQASVFVACLPSSVAPEVLETKLKELVSRIIDPIHVNIIDDRFGNKAAFVQAKTADDAQILLNSQLNYDGIPLRLERAKAHRSLTIWFQKLAGPAPSLRLIRNQQGNIRAMVNELQAPNPFTPARQGDPYSGPGRLFPQVAYTAAFMKKICEAFGPLEAFEPAGIRRPYDGATVTEAWHVKWQIRTDAVHAKLALSFLPFIGWTWSHEERFDGRPYVNGSAGAEPVHSSANSHQLVRKPSRIGVWGAVNGPLSEKIVEEFPPLSLIQTTTLSKSKLQASLSDAIDAPITPTALQGSSPIIVSPIESSLPLVHNSHEAAVDVLENPTGALALDSFHRQPQYSLDTLYVSGIRGTSSNSDVEHLFMPYGSIKEIRRLTCRGEFCAVFITYVEESDAAKAIKAFDDGVTFGLDGCELRVRYRRPYSKNSRRGRVYNHVRILHRSDIKAPSLLSVATPMTERPIDPSFVSESSHSTEETSKDTNGESLETSLTSLEELAPQDLSQGLSSPPLPSGGSPGAEGEVGEVYPSTDAEATPIYAVEVPRSPSPVEVHALVAPQPVFYPQPWQQQQYYPGWGYSYPIYNAPVGMPRYMSPQWYPPQPPPYASSDPYGSVNTPPSHPAATPHRGPILPSGSYQNADGGITYVYAPEVLKKCVPELRSETDKNSDVGRPTHANVGQQQPLFNPPQFGHPEAYLRPFPHMYPPSVHQPLEYLGSPPRRMYADGTLAPEMFMHRASYEHGISSYISHPPAMRAPAMDVPPPLPPPHPASAHPRPYGVAGMEGYATVLPHTHARPPPAQFYPQLERLASDTTFMSAITNHATSRRRSASSGNIGCKSKEDDSERGDFGRSV